MIKLQEKLKKIPWLYLTLVVLGVMLVYTPPTDPDFGWHYKYGEYLFKTGTLLRDNIFSYTYTDYKWVNSYWGFEYILYVTHTYLGSVLATVLVSTLLSIGIVAVVLYLSKNLATRFLGLIYRAGVIGGYAVVVRPHIYSVLFMYFLLISLIFEKRYQKFLPFVFLIWANIHAEFVIGLFIYAIYTLNELVVQIKNRKIQWSTLAIPLLSAVVTLINANGIHLWITLAKELTLPVKSYVKEWSYMQTSTFADSIMVGFILALFLIGGLAFKKAGSWYRFLVIFFVIFSIKSVYMARVFYMIASIGLLVSFDTFVLQLQQYFFEENSNLIKRASKAFALCFFIVLSGGFIYKINLTLHQNLWAAKAKYPYEALNYIRENPVKGNILNNYDWGGYMIWQMPQYKTFIDGRMTSWRENGHYFMEDYYQIYKEPKTKGTLLIQQYIKQYNISTLLESPKAPIVDYLKEQGWQVLYEDSIAVVLGAPTQQGK